MNKDKVLTFILRPGFTIFCFIIISLVAGTLMSPYFLDLWYLLNSTTIYAELGIIALAFTLLMISGEIDLSIASIMTLSACVISRLYEKGVPMGLLIPVALIIGAILGAINGFIVTKTKLPSLIVTLGTMSLYRGIAQVLIGDKSVSGFPKWFVGIDNKYFLKIIPVPLLVIIVFAILFELLLTRTFYGRKIISVGLNSNAATYSLVRVDKYKVELFVLVGIFSAIAGVFSMSRLHLAKYNIGIGGELDVITMVLLGGTAFEGGRGSTIGTAGAFFIIVFVRTAMMLKNMSNHAQMAVVGGLLIVVLMLSSIIESLRNKFC